MNKKRLSSRLFSKKLWDNGCRLKTDTYWVMASYPPGWKLAIRKKHHTAKECFGEFRFNNEYYPAYDLFWDVAMRYNDKLLGTYIDDRKRIVTAIASGSDKKYIEKVIWDNCLFNPKNKNLNQKK